MACYPTLFHDQFCACSLSRNNLVFETSYVKATEVQGDSFEVGAKVMYQGREMVVSNGIDNDGEIKMTDSFGLKTLAEALPKTSITTLECAASYCARDSLQSPLVANPHLPFETRLRCLR